MKLTRTPYLLLAASILFSCRARESSVTRSVEADSESKFSGRVLVFDIYDKTTQLTRQAPGVLVATRGALIPGLKPGETVILTDDQRKGEKYFPLNMGESQTVFVGLEAPSDPAAGGTALTEIPSTTDTLPPLSKQPYAPLSRKSRIPTKFIEVIMYNDIGYVEATAEFVEGTEDKIQLHISTHVPRAYPLGGIRGALYKLLFGPPKDPPELKEKDAERMIRKGGALINKYSGYEGIVELEDGFWNVGLKSKKQTATVDIVGFFAEDPDYVIDLPSHENGFYGKDGYQKGRIIRKDLLPKTIAATIESSEVKFKAPPEMQIQIMSFLNCRMQKHNGYDFEVK